MRGLPRHRGVTLVEIVAVLAIILVLLAILLPTLAHARKRALIAKEQQAIESFKVGLEQYHSDWGDYPQIATSLSNPVTYDADATQNASLQTPLHQIHMEDGAKALFTALCLKLQRRAGSTTYGPYIQMSNFSVDTTNHWLLDPNGQPYIYIPATAPSSVITQNNRFVAFLSLSSTSPNIPMYNWAAVPIIPGSMPQQRYITQPDMQKILGDSNADGKLGSGEQASTTDPYLLWAAGYDQKFGLAPANTPNAGKTDDITNFTIPQNLQQ